MTAKLKRPAEETKKDVIDFFANRFAAILQGKGIPGDVIESVIGSFDDPVDTFQRAQALSAMRREPWFDSICAASKRVENILKKTAPTSEVIRACSPRTRKSLYNAFKAMEERICRPQRKRESISRHSSCLQV